MIHERREDKQAGQRSKFQNVPPWRLQKQRTGKYQYGTPTEERANGLFLKIITQLWLTSLDLCVSGVGMEDRRPHLHSMPNVEGRTCHKEGTLFCP